ncbi:hypothetical protein [Cypionkella sp. TWP1-2-1b2]|uniref:hypothetical protein n=1 Tax=Cypionkella sp. TWP1-2-1b2 TaxID=2804675 RepID=UPI003CF3D9C4
MLRAVFFLVILFGAGIGYLVFASMADPTAFGGKQFTAEERAQGLHCQVMQQGYDRPVQTALQARIGSHDGEDKVRLIDVILGPLQPDGSHKMTLNYSLDRIGQISEVHRATGTMNNADCSFTIATLER